MPEALYVQDGDYSATEDRQAIALHSTAGISRGLTLTASSGRNVIVSRGAAVVESSSGVDTDGRYGAYIQTDTTVTIPASATNYPIYIQVHPTTGVSSIVHGSTPSFPYVTLGNASASASAITAVNNTGARSQPAGVVGGVVSKSGDTITGVLTTTQPVVASGGIKFGGAAGATKRFAIRAYVKTAISLVKSAWSTVRFDTVTTNVNDYGGTPYDAVNGVFTIPVDGIYHVSGHMRFVDTTGQQTGVRYTAVYITNAAGNLKMRHYCDLHGWGALNGVSTPATAKVWDGRETNPNHCNWFGVFDLVAGDKIYFHYHQTSVADLTTRPIGDPVDYGTGEVTWAMVALMQAL